MPLGFGVSVTKFQSLIAWTVQLYQKCLLRHVISC